MKRGKREETKKGGFITAKHCEPPANEVCACDREDRGEQALLCSLVVL